MQKLSILAVVLPFLFSACASGPVVPVPPTVEVIHFNSQLFTPDFIQFEGQVLITNEMRGRLNIQKVEYGADLHDQPLFTKTFADLHPMRKHATQTVTLPFQIEMNNVVNQIEDVLAEESIRVNFRGTVFPEGFAPIPFETVKVIPLPKVPEVAISDVKGSPLDGEFTVMLKLTNGNSFPLTFNDVNTFLNLNGKRYDLLRTECFRQLDPGQSGHIALTMRKTKGKGLSMLVNVVKNQSADFTLGGSVSCQTPHGLIQLPLELQSSTGANAPR